MAPVERMSGPRGLNRWGSAATCHGLDRGQPRRGTESMPRPVPASPGASFSSVHPDLDRRRVERAVPAADPTETAEHPLQPRGAHAPARPPGVLLASLASATATSAATRAFLASSATFAWSVRPPVASTSRETKRRHRPPGDTLPSRLGLRGHDYPESTSSLSSATSGGGGTARTMAWGNPSRSRCTWSASAASSGVSARCSRRSPERSA